jgi:CDP-diacylglycerol--serine O-phosphatidyltransferase
MNNENGFEEQEPIEENGHKRRRGIYLLPNLFTTAGLFAGFYAIVAAIGGRFEAAAIAIFIAMIMDGLDGRVARMTNTQSDFGKEYDSLVDMVAFGLAPALVVYEWALQPMGKLGWLAAFVYAAATALRLARFNTQSGVDKRYFQGLASPSAAALIAGMIWAAEESGATGKDLHLVALFVTVTAGVLMVSNVLYRSFKDIDFKGKVPFVTVVIIMLVFVLISMNPAYVLLIIFVTYVSSGPLSSIRRLINKKRHRHMTVESQESKKEGD